MSSHYSVSFTCVLTSATKQHIAPIFRESPLKVMAHGTNEKMIDQGTMTFVTYKGHCFGITNQHVTQDFERVTANTEFMLALQRHIPMPGRLIFTSKQSDIDFPFDLSVFILNESFVRAGGKIPAPLIHEISTIVEGDYYMALGYPGHMRGKLDRKTLHPIYNIVATCQSASDRMIVLQDELSSASDVMRFGGISGGAIVAVQPDDTYSVVGIVSEGRGQHDVVEQSSCTSDIWVCGIPLTTKLMDRILENVQARNISLDVHPMRFNINIAIGGGNDLNNQI